MRLVFLDIKRESYHVENGVVSCAIIKKQIGNRLRNCYVLYYANPSTIGFDSKCLFTSDYNLEEFSES